MIPDDFDGSVACFPPGVSSISGFASDCTDRNIRMHLADATVDAPALEPLLFEFSKKFLSGDTKGDFITLDQRVKESLKSTGGEIMQMNIAGFEYEVLDCASKELINRFRIIVIKFHGLDLLESFKMGVSRNLLSTHVCVHIYPNNFRALQKKWIWRCRHLWSSLSLGNIEFMAVHSEATSRVHSISITNQGCRYRFPTGSTN